MPEYRVYVLIIHIKKIKFINLYSIIHNTLGVTLSKIYTIYQADSVDIYEQDADSNTKLDTFNAKAISKLSKYKKDTSVPFHNAFTHFKRYELEGSSIVCLTANSEASTEISESVDFIKYNDIKIISADLNNPRFAIAGKAATHIMIPHFIEAQLLKNHLILHSWKKSKTWVASRWP